MRRLLRWLRNGLLLILGVILLLLASIVGIGISPSATKWLANTASEQLPALNIQQADGSLARGLAFDALQWDQAPVKVAAEGFQSDWDLSCLQEQRFCLNDLSLKRLELWLPSSETPPEDSDNPPINLPAIQLPVAIDIQRLNVEHVIVHQGEARHDIRDIDLSVSAAKDTVELKALAAAYLNYSAKLSGQVQLRDNYPLTLSLHADAKPLLEQHNVSVNLEAKGSLEALAISAQLDDAVKATLQAEVAPLDPALPVNATLQWPSLGWPLDSQALVKAESGQLKLKGVMDDWQVQLETQLSGKDIPASQVALNAQSSTKQAQIQSLKVDTLGGEIALNGNVAWAPALKGNTKVSFSNINPETQWPDIAALLSGELEGSGGMDGDAWFANVPKLDINGRWQDKPLRVTGGFTKSRDNIWQFKQIALRNEENQIDLHGQMTDTLDIKAKVALKRLANLLPDLAGQLEGTVDISGPVATPTLQTQLTGRDVQFQTNKVAKLSLNATVPEFAKKVSQIQLSVQGVEAAGQTARDVSLTLEGTQAQHQMALALDSELAQLNTQLSGGLDEAFNWSGLLSQADIKGFEKHLILAKSAALNWQNADQVLTVGAHCWREQSARLCLERDAIVAQSGAAQVSLKNFTFEQLKPWLPKGVTLKGTVGANAEVAWSPQQALQADLDLTVPGIDILVKTPERKKPLSLQFQRLSLTAKARDEGMKAQLRLSSQNLGNTTINAGITPKGDSQQLSGDVDISAVQLSLVKAFLPDFNTLEGQLSAKGTLSGTTQAPLFRGDVNLKGFQLNGKNIPLMVTDGSVTAKVVGDKAQLSGRIQTDKGALDIGGDAAWPLPKWYAKVKLKGDRLRLRQRPTLDAQISPDLLIHATPQQVRVSGNVDIPQASVRIREIPPSAPTLSKDVIIVRNGSPIKAPKKEENPLGIQLNVHVTLGDRVRFAGFGFRTRITGDLDITQQPKRALELSGDLNLEDGKYRSYGQDLVVRKGNILLVGPIDSTTLDVEAVRTITQEADDLQGPEEVVAGLRLTGPISEPQISLFSEPSFNEDEVLSYLVLGRPLSQSSSGEGNLLLQAAVGLGITNGRGVAQDVADALGIEDFTLESEGSGDSSQVVVSGKVTDKLTISYGVGVFKPIRTLTLRYDLTKKLYLETVQGLVDAIDIFYKFEF